MKKRLLNCFIILLGFFLIYPSVSLGEDLEERRACLGEQEEGWRRFEQRIISSTGW
jgi:hypothetical protein